MEMEKDRLKLWLDFGKFFLGTFLIGFISLVVKSGFESREIAIKESEQIGKYVEIALREDVGVRKRFAEYFKTVSVSDEYRERWTDYFDLVNSEFEKIENKAREVQSKIDSLSSKIDSLSAQTDDRYEEKVDSIKEVYETRLIDLRSVKMNLQDELSVKQKVEPLNGTFVIGLYSLRPQENRKAAIKRYINDKNFVFDSEYDYSYKQSWMANRSTVFYYSKLSKIHADQMAKDLGSLTGLIFDVRMGAGLGVQKGKEAVTFFIHYVE